MNQLGRCGGDDDRRGRRAGCPGSRGQGWPGTEPGLAADPVVVPGPGRQDVPAQAGRHAYRRGRAGVVVVCGVLVANRLVVSTDVAVFRRINHWPGWLYPPTWTVQLSGVIGALTLVAAAAALLRRLRLAAAVCLSRVYLGAHFPLDVAAGAGLGMFIGGALNLAFGVPGNRPRTAPASRPP
jgi:hypothetical protein